jgi:putative photosynthetic complex assembly protein 2
VLDHALPVVTTLFIWWFSTGVILFLDGLPRWTFKWSMAAATLVGALALYGIWLTASDTSPAGAYLAFAFAIGLWGWNEMGFLLGHITGSRRTSCPPGAQGFQRFVYATQSIIHHELMILLTGAAIAMACWGGANQFALWTFLILWTMRLSTKLNVFLGVPNITIEFLPPHLAYLKTYFSHKPMNVLFPFSVTASTVVTLLLIQQVLTFDAGTHLAIGFTLLATLMALAVIEHWFLVVPLPFGDMWAWGLKSRKKSASLPLLSADPVKNAATTPVVALASAVPASTLITPAMLTTGNPPSTDPARGWSEGISCAGVRP